MAKTVVTQEMIVQMNELYLEIGTYAGVSRAMGGTPSPSTVKKYIIPGYMSKTTIKKKVFHKDDLPEFATDLFCGVDNWGDLCRLSENEKEEIIYTTNKIFVRLINN